MPQLTLTAKKTADLIAYAKKHNIKKAYIAKDQGAYLGVGPARDKDGKKIPSLLNYFNGCDPSKNDSWWETAQNKFGGDDFGEFFDLEQIKKWPAGIRLKVEITSTQLEISGLR